MPSPEDTSALLELIASRADELYEDAPCGFLFAQPDGLIVKTNQTFLDWTGYSKEELVSRKRFQELLTIGCKIYYETHYAPLLRIQGHLSEVTLDLRGKGERTIPVLINSSEMKDESGNVILVRSTIFNISDRRSYERELLISRNRAEQSERRLSFLARAGEALRTYGNPNQSFAEIARLATEGFCDACTVDLFENLSVTRVASANRFSDGDLPRIKAPTGGQGFDRPFLVVDAEQPAKEDLEQIQSRLMITPGDNFNLQSVLMVPIQRGQHCDGAVVGVLTFYMLEFGRRFSVEDRELATELSDRCCLEIETFALQAEKERAAEALRESNEWLSTTLRSIGDAVIAVNVDKTIAFMNTVAASLTGWSEDEAKGRRMDEVFRIINDLTGEPAFNPVGKVLKEGVVVGLANNTALIRKDGTRCIIEDSAAPIKGAEGQVHGVVLVFKDVTEKHAEEREKHRTLLRLQEEREVREKFVATLTHDLRSPITAVKISAQVILRKAENPGVVQAQAVRVINSVNRADQMIQDLLDANRIRAGEVMTLEMSLFDLAAEVKEALVDLATIHGDRFVYGGQPEARGYWNSAGLRRVIENLCNNAVKYGDPHGMIHVSLMRAGDEVTLSVHNRGNPIPLEDQATLFEPYRRTASAKHGGQKGWGLGLTLVRGVAEAHGGSVSVESNAVEGTTFTVSLPIDARSPHGEGRLTESS